MRIKVQTSKMDLRVAPSATVLISGLQLPSRLLSFSSLRRLNSVVGHQ
jgi:hypothetical protein